jgi:hypothetical protein
VNGLFGCRKTEMVPQCESAHEYGFVILITYSWNGSFANLLSTQ